MKHILLIALLFTATAFGQSGERIKAFKRAHITDALNLTSAEAEKFWPVYNAHEDLLTELRKKERQEVFQIVKGNMDGVSDADANLVIEKSLAFKTNELEQHKNFVASLRNVIPPKKILRLHRAEEEFKRILLERMKNRQNRRKNK